MDLRADEVAVRHGDDGVVKGLKMAADLVAKL